MRVFGWIWVKVAKLLYDIFFIIMVWDGSWQEPLIASLSPKAKIRILNFGPGSISTTIALALRYPETTFVGVDPDPKAVRKAKRRIARKQIHNVVLTDAPLHARLPFDANSFDKAVCVLTFHDRLPDEKLHIARELMRVLKRGGTLHVADYDKPDMPGEGGILEFTRHVSGLAAAEPHISGNWTECLKKAGFSGIRRQSSQSITIGRISVVKAQKR